MEYLKVKCHRCDNSFHLYNRDMSYGERPPMCPHCLIRMGKMQWERLIDAFFTFAEVNKNFRKYHMDRKAHGRSFKGYGSPCRYREESSAKQKY